MDDRKGDALVMEGDVPEGQPLSDSTFRCAPSDPAPALQLAGFSIFHIDTRVHSRTWRATSPPTLSNLGALLLPKQFSLEAKVLVVTRTIW